MGSWSGSGAEQNSGGWLRQNGSLWAFAHSRLLRVTLPPSRAAGERDGLSVEGLCCRYKREPPIFQNLSFSARPGEVLAVTGDNGVGKSTLSRCLCGLMRESAGTIRLNGRILGAKQRQRIAYCVMQDVNHQLFSDSVWGECQLAMEGLSDQRIQEVLERLHLLAFREKHPMSLSGGQKQRLAVATAMLSQSRCWYSTSPPVVWTMQECRKWPVAHGNWRTRAGWFWW